MTKRLSLSVGLVLFAIAAGIGLYVSYDHYHPTPSGGRGYDVHYVWDNGIKNLRITNAKSGVEESDPKWRARVSNEAAGFLTQLTKNQGLARANGEFSISFGGYEEPYLPQILGWTGDPNMIRDPDFIPPMRAAYNCDTDALKSLIAAGSNIHAADQHGWTALMFAAGCPNATSVQALLAAGAQVNVKNKNRETPLYLAASLSELAVAKQLLAHGADVNATTNYGGTPLLATVWAFGGYPETYLSDSRFAPASDRLALARLLIAAGANVNARASSGETALMRAASLDCKDLAQALIQAGADVNTKDNRGKSALAWARQSGNLRIVRLLKLAGAR